MKNLLFSLVIIFLSVTLHAQQTTASSNPLTIGLWLTADAEKDDDSYSEDFKKYKSIGVDEILVNTLTDPKLLKRIVPLAKKEGLKVHAWMMAMNRPDDEEALKHPEWYAVSRKGESCHDPETRPYVDYYQWLCPNHEGARNHVLGIVKGLAEVEGIESVHLDYIRFPDVYLPIGLLPKYNLKQETELPEFDFCYCDVCVEKFKKEHHKNPREFNNPAIDMEWKQFRLNSIRGVVNDAYQITKKYNVRLTAAVFPYPEMADHMVRQRWDKWDIDGVYPMIYHGFYNESVDWVGFVTAQGVNDLKSKRVNLTAGLYLPDFKSAEEVQEAVTLAIKNGAVGVSFYDASELDEENLARIRSLKK